MGNIFSSEERLLRHQRNKEKKSHKILGTYEQYGYSQTDTGKRNEHRYRNRRNVSFHGKCGKNEYFQTKSHSLNAILEELYSFAPDDYPKEGGTKINFETSTTPLIPRIKLKRSTSSLKDEKRYKTLCKMSSESEIFLEGNPINSSPNILKRENNDSNADVSDSNIAILINDQNYDEISRKSDENYFVKNFDDCMKRLQLIEKEHELIEKAADVQFCILQESAEDVPTDTPETVKTPPGETIYDSQSECDFKSFENDSVGKKDCENEMKLESSVKNSGQTENKDNCSKNHSMPPDALNANPAEEDDVFFKENKEPTSVTWYSNLKQRFEKEEQENQEQNFKEMSCRITGATLKNQKEKSKSEDKEKDTRHYFFRLMKTSKSLIDEELPDPDKVKHIRAMFQESLNSTLKRKLDGKLGGSLQNISIRAKEQQRSRPLSAQCYRNDMFCETRNNQTSDEEKEKKASAGEISKPLKDGSGEFQIENTKKKLFEKYEKDLRGGREYKNRKALQPKWTDTGSVSSGISSDLSSYDTDLESYSREGTEQDEMTISDEDLLEEVKDKHYVQNEVLEKIRSFGTSVTYYGGEMITCSVGPLLSPTTQAIMEEIGEKYGHETSPARSFDEFYRKYVETNENSRKKKLGRTRSFGQNDVFQKPNVLSNTEIEMYKNDLEIEIGIKKPLGIPQNSLKRKITKSVSLGGGTEATEKAKEKYSEPSILPSESEFLINSDKIKEVSEKTLDSAQNEILNTNETESTTAVQKLSSKTEFADGVDSGINQMESAVKEEEKLQKLDVEEESSNLSATAVLRKPSIGENAPSKTAISAHSMEYPAKEIYFSYEKNIFNGKRNSDMEFEEFEVCESLSEKLEKLEKMSSFEKSTDSQETSANNGTQLENSLENHENKNLDSSITNPVTENLETKAEIRDTSRNEEPIELTKKIETNQNERRDSKCNYSRWPIETSVMVDIQKNNEQTPKIITSGKTVAKTKLRLF